MKGIILPALVLILFMVHYAAAQEADGLNFQTTEQGIINSLTADIPKVKTRSLGENKTRSVKVVAHENNQIIHKEITVADDAKTQSVNLKIEFDLNSFSIRPDSYGLIDKLGKALTSDNLKEKAILIKGHTDSDGKDEYNLVLSLNRARAVKSYLVEHFSIPESKLKIYGYGKTMPLLPDINPVNKQINRRVEIAVDED